MEIVNNLFSYIAHSH